jgi:hypothetical protein
MTETETPDSSTDHHAGPLLRDPPPPPGWVDPLEGSPILQEPGTAGPTDEGPPSAPAGH